jgi:hypothetical protein
MQDLTICSIYVEADRPYIEANVKLLDLLNPTHGWECLIGNNSFHQTGKELVIADDRCRVRNLIEAEITSALELGANYHHGAALNHITREIQTRYCLIIDADFFIVRPNWIKDVTEYMEKEGLAFFGAPWHPKWFMKERYFPCVHCFFIDLSLVRREDLNFLPITSELWSNSRNGNRQSKEKCVANIWGRLRSVITSQMDRKKIGEAGDTGSQIYRQFSTQDAYKWQSVTPVYRPAVEFLGPRGWLLKANRLLERFLPDRLCYLPKKKGAFSVQGFNWKEFGLEESLGWEEFIWQGKPFGFHIRRYPRKNESLASHALGLNRVVGHIIERINTHDAESIVKQKKVSRTSARSFQ